MVCNIYYLKIYMSRNNWIRFSHFWNIHSSDCLTQKILIVPQTFLCYIFIDENCSLRFVYITFNTPLWPHQINFSLNNHSKDMIASKRPSFLVLPFCFNNLSQSALWVRLSNIQLLLSLSTSKLP